MKKFLLLPLIALGLVAWAPSQAKAGVHVTFGFGVPAYTDTRGRITAATILFTHIIIIRIGITGITTTIIVTGIVDSTLS